MTPTQRPGYPSASPSPDEAAGAVPEGKTAPAALSTHRFEWFGTGRTLLEAKLAALAEATEAVRLEIYIWADSEIGTRFLQALTAAAQRGVKVWLMVDALGSMELEDDYFAPLIDAGGAVKWFNRPSLATWSFRDHRKLLVIDGALGFVGGCNIGPDYHGDGVAEGWRDGGLSVRGMIVRDLGEEFDRQFELAEAKQWKVERTRRQTRRGRVPRGADVEALFIAPGLGESPLRTAIRADLKDAREVAITSPYFLPTPRLRAQLATAVKNGARVRLLLAGKTDVKLMQLASRSLYRRMLAQGIEIYEYAPQILHAKALVIDDTVYVGSSNLDPRSLRINFEIMLRVRDPAIVRAALASFEEDLRHSRRVTPEEWRGRRSWWTRLRQRVAYWLLARLDPRLAEGSLRKWKRRARLG